MQSPLDPRFAGAQRFQGKVCVITGSGQGIGAATARRLGSEGGIIALADRSEPGVTRVGEQLTANGVESMTFIGDLGDWDTCQRLMNEVQAQYGHIDVLVNNVGGTIHLQYLWDYNEQQIHDEMDRSFWPTMNCMCAVLPHMLKQGHGSIVNLGSSAVKGILRGPYAAAKGAVIGLTTSVAREVATSGIRINCVAPHATEVKDRIVPRNPDPLLPREQEIRESWSDRVQGKGPYAGVDFPIMGRSAQPDEQAAAIAFLASEDASFMTGQVLWVGNE